MLKGNEGIIDCYQDCYTIAFKFSKKIYVNRASKKFEITDPTYLNHSARLAVFV